MHPRWKCRGCPMTDYCHSMSSPSPFDGGIFIITFHI
jgi:hypothetical protein